MEQEREREKQLTRVTLAGSAGNLLLVTFKFVAGILGHSAAMMADAVHSLSDFITDLIVLVFVRVGARPQDRSHDYGHGKFETLATFFVGLALVGAAIGIIVGGAVKFARWLQGETLEMPGRLALWAALVSILVKEILYRYTAAKGKALHSPAVVANAWHHRSDALSSIGAAIGIGGALLLGGRWAVLDPLASIVVGAMLVKVAWELLRVSTGELTDESLPEETEQEIEAIIHSFPEVSEPHNLRTRQIGNRIAIEAHVRMDGTMSLHAAHEEVSAIEKALKARFGDNTLVTIHMEPKKE
jgi:cation diffusion facilitator family transporter